MPRLNPWDLFSSQFAISLNSCALKLRFYDFLHKNEKHFGIVCQMKYIWWVNKKVLTIKSFFGIFTVIYRYSNDPGWFGIFGFCCHGQKGLFLNKATFPGKKQVLCEIKLIRDKKEDGRCFVCFSRSQQFNEMSITVTSWIESENVHTLIFLTNI